MRVAKIHAVRDTREWVEGPGDRWVPVAGSGSVRDCDRCGRSHEVHAEVEYEDGTTAVVGTGCMGEGKDPALKIGRSLGSMSGTLARTRAELEVARKRYAAICDAFDQAQALPVPEAEDAHAEIRFGARAGTRVRARRIGDVVASEYWGPPEEAELMRHEREFWTQRLDAEARRLWCEARASEFYGEQIGFGSRAVAQALIQGLERKIEQSEKRIAKKMNEIKGD